MFCIDTLTQHERMSTQSLLLAISEAVARGETEFHIHASGQHDIGGPLWNAEGRTLRFFVTNPGQRVGCMGLDQTDIVVEGPAPADVGGLNSGARNTNTGDAGDTAGHCAASGIIYIGGRAGTRSGSLMKHDPLYPEPEMWILKSTGSFPCEFMGGGRIVVCGLDSEHLPSVLGERACVGMVGGVVYFRGNPGSFAEDDVAVHDLNEEDIAFLSGGMDDFLHAVERSDVKERLTNWSEWKKLLPLQKGEHAHRRLSTAISACASPRGTMRPRPLPANTPAPRTFPRTSASICCVKDAPKRPCAWCSTIPPSPVPYAAMCALTPAWRPARAASASTCPCR